MIHGLEEAALKLREAANAHEAALANANECKAATEDASNDVEATRRALQNAQREMNEVVHSTPSNFR